MFLNYRVTQKKTECIKLLIIPTKLKQIYSNFVDLNFCLCMIISKSFSNLGRITQKLCSLQNMLLMSSSALGTDLHPLSKIVSHSHALLSGNMLCFLLQLHSRVYQLSEDSSGTHCPSDTPADNSLGSSSPLNEVPTSTSHFLLINFYTNLHTFTI